MDGGGQGAILWRQERGGGDFTGRRIPGKPWENHGKMVI